METNDDKYDLLLKKFLDDAWAIVCQVDISIPQKEEKLRNLPSNLLNEPADLVKLHIQLENECRTTFIESLAFSDPRKYVEWNNKKSLKSTLDKAWALVDKLEEKWKKEKASIKRGH